GRFKQGFKHLSEHVIVTVRRVVQPPLGIDKTAAKQARDRGPVELLLVVCVVGIDGTKRRPVKAGKPFLHGSEELCSLWLDRGTRLTRYVFEQRFDLPVLQFVSHDQQCVGTRRVEINDESAK